MRCVSCGLPLSPKRTHCPKCGTASTREPGRQNEDAASQGEVPQYAFPAPQNGFPTLQVNGQAQMPYASAWEIQQQAPSVPQAVYQPMSGEMPPSGPFPDMGSTPFASGQPQQLWLSGGDSPNRQTSDGKSASRPRLKGTARANSGLSPKKPKQANGRSTARLNFTIAGLCVLTGGLILIFVYIISFSLPPTLASSQQAVVATATTQGFSPTAQGTPANATATIQATPAATPTVGLPGAQYIDTARMASSVNTTTAQPIQLTSKFKTKQPIFVTFMLHPQNTGGAVCLLWYLNQKPFSHYAFSVDTTPQSAYSYAYAGSPGSGSVEIYWASTTACTDTELAQVLKFTVSL